MFLKIFTIQQFTHCDDEEFQSLTILLLKANFLTSSLNLSLNSFFGHVLFY